MPDKKQSGGIAITQVMWYNKSYPERRKTAAKERMRCRCGMMLLCKAFYDYTTGERGAEWLPAPE